MFKNNEYSVSLLEENGQITNVRIVSNHKIFQFSPYLITINGSIPEGTFRDDYNSISNIYKCDSTYNITTDSICISFAMECSNHYRLDFIVYESIILELPNGFNTLYLENIHHIN